MAIDFAGLGKLAVDNQYDAGDALKNLATVGYLQQQAATNAYKLRSDQRQAELRPLIAAKVTSGDLSGAQADAAASGDTDYANQISKLSDDHQKQITGEAQALGSVAAHLQALPAEQRAAAYRAAIPALKGAGFADHELSAADLSDDGLAGYISAAQKVTDTVQQQQRSREQDLAERKENFDEHRVNYIPVPQGGFLQGVLPTGGLYQGDGPQPNAPGSLAPASGGALTTRLNNPGALRPDGSNWQGMTGVSDGFVQFDNAADGRRAQIINLQNQARLHGINTLADLTAKYAPTSDHNDPQAYAATIGQALGVGPHATINLADPAIASRVADVMARVEAGGSPAQGYSAQPSVRGGSATRATLAGEPGVMPGGGQITGGRIDGNPKSADVPSGYRSNPDGSLSFIPGGPADPAVAAKGKTNLTESQGKATGYYARANLALQQLAAVGNAPPPGAGAQFADELPLGIGQHFISDSSQQQLNARRAFVAAILRQESGAAISQSEFNSYNKLYFDQTGDSPQVRANKSALRQQAVQSLKIEAGPGASQIDGAGSIPISRAGARQQFSATPPHAAIAYLRQHPELRGAFDQKYGSGASASALR